MTALNEILFKNLVQLDGPGPDLSMKINDVPQVPGIDYIAIPRRRVIYIRNCPPGGTWISYNADMEDYVAFMKPDGSQL